MKPIACKHGVEDGACKECYEEQTKQEPIAWMREDGVIAFYKQKEMDSQGYKWQPLYTEPQYRELNDEEIISEWVGNGRNYYNFARSILKKASEK